MCGWIGVSSLSQADKPSAKTWLVGWDAGDGMKMHGNKKELVEGFTKCDGKAHSYTFVRNRKCLAVAEDGILLSKGFLYSDLPLGEMFPMVHFTQEVEVSITPTDAGLVKQLFEALQIEHPIVYCI